MSWRGEVPRPTVAAVAGRGSSQELRPLSYNARWILRATTRAMSSRGRRGGRGIPPRSRVIEPSWGFSVRAGLALSARLGM